MLLFDVLKSARKRFRKQKEKELRKGSLSKRLKTPTAAAFHLWLTSEPHRTFLKETAVRDLNGFDDMQSFWNRWPDVVLTPPQLIGLVQSLFDRAITALRRKVTTLEKTVASNPQSHEAFQAKQKAVVAISDAYRSQYKIVALLLPYFNCGKDRELFSILSSLINAESFSITSFQSNVEREVNRLRWDAVVGNTEKAAVFRLIKAQRLCTYDLCYGKCSSAACSQLHMDCCVRCGQTGHGVTGCALQHTKRPFDKFGDRGARRGRGRGRGRGGANRR